MITGAGGSIGSAITALLASYRPARLAVLDSHEPSLFHLRQRLLADFPDVSQAFVLADVRDCAKIDSVFAGERPEVVFHLAAYKHVPLAEDNADQVVAVNVLGTLAVVAAAQRHGTVAFVYPSTDKAVNPPSLYGATKRLCELLLRALDGRVGPTRVAIVRLVNVFGTQGSMIDVFWRQVARGEPLTVTDPRMTRYCMTLTEATHLLARAALRPAGEVLTLDTGEPLGLAALARRVWELAGGSGEPSIRITGIRPGERLHEELRYPGEELGPTDQPGVLVVRDCVVPGYEPLAAAVEALRADLPRLESPEIRRRVFELIASGAPRG